VCLKVHNSGQDVERFATKREATLEAIPTLLFGDFRQNQHSMMHVMKDVSPFMNDGGRLINIESFYAQLNIVGKNGVLQRIPVTLKIIEQQRTQASGPHSFIITGCLRVSQVELTPFLIIASR
jgi:hypothetical protein